MLNNLTRLIIIIYRVGKPLLQLPPQGNPPSQHATSLFFFQTTLPLKMHRVQLNPSHTKPKHEDPFQSFPLPLSQKNISPSPPSQQKFQITTVATVDKNISKFLRSAQEHDVVFHGRSDREHFSILRPLHVAASGRNPRPQAPPLPLRRSSEPLQERPSPEPGFPRCV